MLDGPSSLNGYIFSGHGFGDGVPAAEGIARFGRIIGFLNIRTGSAVVVRNGLFKNSGSVIVHESHGEGLRHRFNGCGGIGGRVFSVAGDFGYLGRPACEVIGKLRVGSFGGVFGIKGGGGAIRHIFVRFQNGSVLILPGDGIGLDIPLCGEGEVLSRHGLWHIAAPASEGIAGLCRVGGGYDNASVITLHGGRFVVDLPGDGIGLGSSLVGRGVNGVAGNCGGNGIPSRKGIGILRVGSFDGIAAVKLGDGADGNILVCFQNGAVFILPGDGVSRGFRFVRVHGIVGNDEIIQIDDGRRRNDGGQIPVLVEGRIDVISVDWAVGRAFGQGNRTGLRFLPSRYFGFQD